MEELQALDKKAIETQYIASYHYTRPQKIVAIIAIFITLCGIISAGTFLAVAVINAIVK